MRGGALVWNTFLGGSRNDQGFGIAVDGSGNVYVAGVSGAAWGSPVRAYTGAEDDAFAAKLDASGALVWNTFLGGSGTDIGTGIAVDGSGRVFVTGYSDATWGSPVRAHTGAYEAFAAKLDASGALLWNTFLGSGDDVGNAIAVDGSGNVYVAGNSRGTWGSPVRAYSGGIDAFAAKLDTSGALLWSTFMGGAGGDFGTAIAVDKSGNVYVAGDSGAAWGNPVSAFTGAAEAFAAKLDAGGALLWNTFVGPGGGIGNGIAVDGGGNVYVTGASGANTDALAAKLDPGGALLWNAFIGGSGTVDGKGITVDQSGNVYLVGWSDATWGSPVRAYTASDNAFVAKINPFDCIGGPTALCLNDGRFQVTANYDAGGGNSGSAHAVQLTPDTGYLWFFNSSNAEVVIKVLNGCALDGHYWVFAGGLTNVNVVMTVTDTDTHSSKTYTNPPGTKFQPIQDTSAFATCSARP
jgi:hypothetical protein